MKKPFLLLEVLIALFLALLCIIPLIKRPIEMMQVEIEQLEKFERERLADWTFSEVKELLLKTEIPWKKLPQKWETSATEARKKSI